MLYADRLSRLDIYFARAMDTLISQMAAVQRPITVDDLPDQIRDQFLSTDGKRNLVIAYPQQAIMDRENGLRRFTERMAEILPAHFRDGDGSGILVRRDYGRDRRSRDLYFLGRFSPAPALHEEPPKIISCSPYRLPPE